MGYVFGTQWTDDMVQAKILDCVSALGLKRMPSRAEFHDFYGSDALTNRIRRSGGYYDWADRLGLPMKESETQTGKDGEAIARVVNPVVDWTDNQVWSFLQDAKVPVNPLYECGLNRVGCIGCPLAKKSKRYAEFRRWPAYEKLYIQAFDRMLDERRARGKLDGSWMMGGTGQDVFRWWMEEDVLPGQMSVEDFI